MAFVVAARRRRAEKTDLGSLYGMVMATIPCTLWLGDADDKVFQRHSAAAWQLLPNDPYYRAIFNHCALYRAAYTGRILDAEIYAARLIEENAAGHLQRYVIPAQLLAMVPVAMRGYGHLLGTRVAALLSQLEESADGAAKAASYRAAAIISLCQNQRAESLAQIALAHRYDTRSGFGTVWQEIDRRIEGYAASDALFDPIRDIVVTGLEDVHFAPNSGQLLSRVLQATEQAFASSERDYGQLIAAALAEHFAVEAACVDKSTRLADGCIGVQFPHFAIVLRGIPGERQGSLRTQIATLSPLLKSLAHMRSYRIAAESSSKDRAVAATAYQVAHDIRSPLAALDVVAQNIGEVREDVRVLMKNAVDRIKEIADVLIAQNRGNAPNLATATSDLCMPVAALVDEIIAEKKAMLGEVGGRCIDHGTAPQDQALFVDRHVSELRRSLSNLLTNAVEAIAPGGRVSICVKARGNAVTVEVQDNGCGIPAEIVPQLFARKATFGKTDGNGLGLHFAKETAELLGGSIDLTSRPGAGTSVTMTFPSAAPPPWFQPAIRLRPGDCVVSVDDDRPIHQLWRVRLQQHCAQGRVELRSFTDSEAFSQWWEGLPQARRASVLVLADYEMQSRALNGVALIDRLQLQKKSILVTSHCNSAALQQTCVAQRIRMIPKSMASSIPLQVA